MTKGYSEKDDVVVTENEKVVKSPATKKEEEQLKKESNTVIEDIKRKHLENYHLDKKDQHEISHDDQVAAGIVPGATTTS